MNVSFKPGKLSLETYTFNKRNELILLQTDTITIDSSKHSHFGFFFKFSDGGNVVIEINNNPETDEWIQYKTIDIGVGESYIIDGITLSNAMRITLSANLGDTNVDTFIRLNPSLIF